MAIALSRLRAGMVLYDRHKHRMGNTTIQTLGEWPVKIIEMREHGAMVSWNMNRPEFWSERRLKKLFDWSMYEKCAEVQRGLCDQVISVKLKPLDQRF